jgi:hypothetical protein
MMNDRWVRPDTAAMMRQVLIGILAVGVILLVFALLFGDMANVVAVAVATAFMVALLPPLAIVRSRNIDRLVKANPPGLERLPEFQRGPAMRMSAWLLWAMILVPVVVGLGGGAIRGDLLLGIAVGGAMGLSGAVAALAWR